MKTNEVNIPWDPREDDQKVDKNNASDGIDQLKRDSLRFLEMFPDIKMGGAVNINLRLAFPMATNTQYRDVLIKKDFKEENHHKLLEKLGIPTFSKEGNMPSLESSELFKKIVCRYLHSQMLSKTPFSKGLDALNFAIQEMEAGLGAEVQQVKTVDTPLTSTVMKAISADILMRRIKLAKEDKRFREKFEKDFPEIQIGNIETDRKRFIINRQKTNFPIYGRPLVDRILSIVDEQEAHQGSEIMLARLQKEKYEFFNENGDPVMLDLVVSNYQCSHCQEVKNIKALCPETKGKLLMVPEEHIQEVLEYADRKHQGFGSAYQRIKSWCDFGGDLDEFKRLVIHFIFVNLHY